MENGEARTCTNHGFVQPLSADFKAQHPAYKDKLHLLTAEKVKRWFSEFRRDAKADPAVSEEDKRWLTFGRQSAATAATTPTNKKRKKSCGGAGGGAGGGDMTERTKEKHLAIAAAKKAALAAEAQKLRADRLVYQETFKSLTSAEAMQVFEPANENENYAPEPAAGVAFRKLLALQMEVNRTSAERVKEHGEDSTALNELSTGINVLAHQLAYEICPRSEWGIKYQDATRKANPHRFRF